MKKPTTNTEFEFESTDNKKQNTGIDDIFGNNKVIAQSQNDNKGTDVNSFFSNQVNNNSTANNLNGLFGNNQVNNLNNNTNNNGYSSSNLINQNNDKKQDSNQINTDDLIASKIIR